MVKTNKSNEVFFDSSTKCEKRRELYNRIFTCDYIIYNIKDDARTIDEAMWVLDQLHENIATISSQKMFILISSMLTWAKSSPLDEVSSRIPFLEVFNFSVQKVRRYLSSFFP